MTLELPPGSLVSERELMDGSASDERRCGRRCARSPASAWSTCTRGAGCSSRGSTSATSPALSEVRNTLESRARRLAAERATDADRAETDALLAELDRSRHATSAR